MKKIILILLSALSLSACGVFNTSEYNPSTTTPSPERVASYIYLTFEDATVMFATDIVIAQYVGSKSFGEYQIEFEFVVSERLLGNATERIFIYAGSNIHADVSGHDREVSYMPGRLNFIPSNSYLLPLIGTSSPYSRGNDDGDNFVFIRNLVVDLDTPPNSIMYSELLSEHTASLDIDERTSAQEIISLVERLAELIESMPERRPVFIRSQEIEEIINGSPDVLLVEISEPRRLSHEQLFTDGGLTDLYYVTVIQPLKGTQEVGDELILTFVADTVQIGERHIVAVSQNPGGFFFQLTSENSLFSEDQLEEIMFILNNE